MSRAEYMREYRAKKKAVVDQAAPLILSANRQLRDDVAVMEDQMREIDRLRDEVARLKRELAARPVDGDLERAVHRARTVDSAVDMSFRQFRPAPKSGKR